MNSFQPLSSTHRQSQSQPQSQMQANSVRALADKAKQFAAAAGTEGAAAMALGLERTIRAAPRTQQQDCVPVTWTRVAWTPSTRPQWPPNENEPAICYLQFQQHRESCRKAKDSGPHAKMLAGRAGGRTLLLHAPFR